MSVRELRILDSVTSPTGRTLVGLGELVDALVDRIPPLAHSMLTVSRGAWGQGEWACSVEDELTTKATTAVEAAALTDALDAGEVFYNVEFSCDSPPVRFGVVDSAWLFVAGDDDLIEAISAQFTDVYIVTL